MPIMEIGNGIHLQYEEFGSGDKYLLCAQQGHSKIDSHTIELSKRGFHVYNITIRGYSGSTHVSEDHGEEWYNIWADDTVAFADAVGIDKFFYTGVSHGAGIGWTICMRHPERLVAFLGVVAGPHSRDGEETGEARMRTIKAAETPETWKEHTDGFAKMMYANLERELQASTASAEEKEKKKAILEEFIQSIRSMTREEALINPRKPFPKQKTEEELIEALSSINVPTLLLGGFRDDISTPQNLLRSLGAVKNSKLIMYSDASHGLDREHQSEICDDIIEFCKQRNLL